MEANTLAEVMGIGAVPPVTGNTGTVPPANMESAPVVPAPPQTVVPPVATPAAADPAAVAEATPATSATPKDRLFAGKYPSPDELEKGHVNLTAKFNEQSAELGALRKAMEIMKPQQPEQAQPPSVAQQITRLKQAVDNGEVSADQYETHYAQIIANAAREEARKEIQYERSEADARQSYGLFTSQNPDFVPSIESGGLDQFYQSSIDPATGKSRLGLLPNDPVTTFHALKAHQVSEQMAQLQQQQVMLVSAAREEGRKQALAELTAKAAGGANALAASPPSAGQGMQTLPDKPMSLDQMVTEGMKAIYGGG